MTTDRIDSTALQGDGKLRRARLQEWSKAHGRSFPWRESPGPWPVLVAEILLRRTRADQVHKVLPGILTRFPDPFALASASLEEVIEASRGTGLVWRARNLHEAAKILVNSFGGQIPLDESTLQTLPGVGPYVAASTLAATTSAEVLLIDTNTVRVAARVFGLNLAGDVRRTRAVRSAVEGLLGGSASGKHWWAVIDMAYLICRPHKPDCPRCPIKDLCRSGISSQSLDDIQRPR